MGKFNEYTQKATPADNDTLMIYDATSKANKLSPFSGIWNWIVGKLTNAVISNLQTSNQTVLGAINELNSNLSKLYVSSTQNISDFDSKYTTNGRLRILYGIISNIAYISFDVIWIRIQFKATADNFFWRIRYGDSPIGEWTQLKNSNPLNTLARNAILLEQAFDYNELKTTGAYYLNGGEVSKSNNRPNDNCTNCYLLILAYGDTRVTQIVFPGNHLYISYRSLNTDTDTWNEWKTIK